MAFTGMTPIHIDFFSGSHGNFVEYVVNTYLYNGPKFDELLFTPLGASHGVRTNSKYLNSKRADSNHYTEFNIPIPESCSQLVRIVIPDYKGYICYQVNVINRAGDQTAQTKISKIDNQLNNLPAQLRNFYYSKFMDKSLGYNVYWNSNSKYDVFEFNMTALYSLREFYQELYKLAKFLNTTFVPNDNLAVLWKKFINKNHGFLDWEYCNQVLQDIFLNNNYCIDLTVQQQALLNCFISNTIGMYNGELFDNNQYPTTTGKIYKIICQHLDTFDNRF